MYKLIMIRKLVNDEIKIIDEDKRFHSPSATVGVNAPLALIQMGMEAKMELLKKLKEILDGN